MRLSSPSAFHNFIGRPEPSRCYPNTRMAILGGLVRWMEGQGPDDNHPVTWLSGGAGAGKSAVAQSLAERCQALGYIVASFFFFRPDDSRNHADSLIPTIAYQIARGYPAIQASIEAVVQQDPNIFNQDLRQQIVSLIIRPFLEARKNSDIPQCVIIIDGLDECIEEEMQGCIIAALLDVISFSLLHVTSTLLPRFMICSRPEEDIIQVFCFPLSGIPNVHKEVNLSNDSHADQDILTFLMAHFNDIKRRHRRRDLIPSSWPKWKDVRFLQNRSSGHFIYAKTAMKFISNHVRPMTALKVILGLETSPWNSCEPFAELDVLFQHILQRALSNTAIDTMRFVLGFLILSEGVATEYHRDVLELFLGLHEGALDTLLVDLNSLISTNYDMGPVFLHKSFPDFLLDSSRAGQFFIKQDAVQALIWTRRCQLIAGRWNRKQGEYKQCFWRDFYLCLQRRAIRIMATRSVILVC